MKLISRDSRKHLRHKLIDTFVVNQDAVCQVLDLSSGGVSFGCTIERNIPDNWTVDIIDNSGVHLFDIPVKTVWAEKNGNLKTRRIYHMIVGAQFNSSELSPDQQSALDQLVLLLQEHHPK